VYTRRPDLVRRHGKGAPAPGSPAAGDRLNLERRKGLSESLAGVACRHCFPGDPPLPVPPPPLDGIRILLVDDDPDELSLLGALLHAAGAEVTAVGTVEDALREFQGARPRVLISDLMIPGHDGFTLIRRVRRMEEGEGGGLPAIAITAFDTPDQRRYALAEGFDEYIAKPVHETIVAAVARLLQTRHAA